MDCSRKKSDRSARRIKLKSQDNKYYGSQKHIRILMEKKISLLVQINQPKKN